MKFQIVFLLFAFFIISGCSKKFPANNSTGNSGNTIYYTQPPLPPPPIVNQYNGNVCFYFPDPTGTVGYTWVTFDSPVPGLISVTINNLSAVINGVWCKDCSPKCPVSTDYNLYNVEPGENCVFFNLAPGTYSWVAGNSIINMSNYPGVSQQFTQYWLNPHSASGTITVNPGDSCILQKIVFQ